HRVCAALDRGGFWEKFKTEWVCLDAELMPWSAKAQELLRLQYAAVGAAAKASLAETVASLAAVASNNEEANHLFQRSKQSLEDANLFVESYRRYCWKVNSVSDLKL